MGGMASNLSEDMTRCATDEASVFGIALYEGDVKDGRFNGTLRFNVSDPEDAERWLRGEPIQGTKLKADENGHVITRP